jgi:hypothetical protein
MSIFISWLVYRKRRLFVGFTFLKDSVDGITMMCEVEAHLPTPVFMLDCRECRRLSDSRLLVCLWGRECLTKYFFHLRMAFWLLSWISANEKMGQEWGKGCMYVKDQFKPMFPFSLTWLLDMTLSTHGWFCPTIVISHDMPTIGGLLLFICWCSKYSSAPVSACNTFQDLPQLSETADNTGHYM